MDVAIDAVGHPKVFEQAFYARDLAGRVVMVGVPTPDMRIELHLQGRLPLERFVTETIGLEEVEAAFEKMHRGEVLRSVVVL